MKNVSIFLYDNRFHFDIQPRNIVASKAEILYYKRLTFNSAVGKSRTLSCDCQDSVTYYLNLLHSTPSSS